MSAFKIDLSICSNKGKVRKRNEDNFTVNGKIRSREKSSFTSHGIVDADKVCMLGVFDGMGGEESGDVASDIAAQFSAHLIEKLETAVPEEFDRLVNGYVSAANREICQRLRNNDSDRGGTTFALVYIRDGLIYPYSLGDSRIYYFDGTSLTQITADHTLAMKKYKANIYTLEEALNSPDSHKLTLFLGVDVDLEGLDAEKYPPIEMRENSKLLFCSDGLYDMCDEETIARILSGNDTDYASLLVREALSNGGIDNVTCITAEFIKGE